MKDLTTPWFATHAHVQYAAPYNKAHARADNVNNGRYPTCHAPALVLSIPPDVKDPLPRIRKLIREIQLAHQQQYTGPVPTLYLTLMPRVDGVDYSIYSTNYKIASPELVGAHPGVHLFHADAGEKPSSVQVNTLRLDATWQAVIYSDPAAYVDSPWYAGIADYKLHVCAESGEYSVSYRDLHTACPLTKGGFVDGFEGCLVCPHNDVYCRVRFLREHLNALDETILLNTEWVRRSGQEDCVIRGFNPDAAVHDARHDLLHDLRVVKDAGFTWASHLQAGVSKYRTGNEARPVLVTELNMSHRVLVSAKESRSEVALKAAETRKLHNEVCGKGEDACVLREDGCAAWSRYRNDCSHRRVTTDELNEEALARLPHVRTVPLQDLQRATLLTGKTFDYGTAKGRTQCGTFLGVSRNTRTVNSLVSWAIQLGPARSPEYKYFDSWAAMRRWIRMNAPWALGELDDTETRANDVTVSPLMQAVFHYMQAIKSIQSGYGGWGSSWRDVTSYKPVGRRNADTGAWEVYKVSALADYLRADAADMYEAWTANTQQFTGLNDILPA